MITIITTLIMILLEIEEGSQDIEHCGNDVFATLDCCQPKHIFHVSCITTWAETENACPQCKQRFGSFAVYGVERSLKSITRVTERIQRVPVLDEFEVRDADDWTCRLCHSADDERPGHLSISITGRGVPVPRAARSWLSPGADPATACCRRPSLPR